MAVNVDTHMKSLTAAFALSILNDLLFYYRYALRIYEEVQSKVIESGCIVYCVLCIV